MGTKGNSDVAQGYAVRLMQHLVVPTFVLNPKRRVVIWNRACERLTGVAAGAAGAARDAAKAELGSLPLSKDAAKAQVSKLIDQVAKAVSSAGEAALNGSPVAAAEIKPAKKSK